MALHPMAEAIYAALTPAGGVSEAGKVSIKRSLVVHLAQGDGDAALAVIETMGVLGGGSGTEASLWLGQLLLAMEPELAAAGVNLAAHVETSSEAQRKFQHFTGASAGRPAQEGAALPAGTVKATQFIQPMRPIKK